MSIGMEEESPEYTEPEPECGNGPPPDFTAFVLQEIARERIAQDAKWGEQNHPLLDPALIGREPQRMATEYEVPHAGRAQFLCQTAAKRGTVTWGHILVEEVSEFICANPEDVVAMREELVQI